MTISDSQKTALGSGASQALFKTLKLDELLTEKSAPTIFKAYPGDEGLVTIQQARIKQFVGNTGQFESPEDGNGVPGLVFSESGKLQFENIRFVGNLKLSSQKMKVWLPKSRAEFTQFPKAIFPDHPQPNPKEYPYVALVLSENHPFLARKGSSVYASTPPGFPEGRYYSGIGISLLGEKVEINQCEVLFSEGWDEAVPIDCEPTDSSKPCYNPARLHGYRGLRGLYLDAGIKAEASKLACAYGLNDQHFILPNHLLSFSPTSIGTMTSDGVKSQSGFGTITWSNGYLGDCAHHSLSLLNPTPGEGHLIRGNVIQNRLHTNIGGDGPGVIENNWFYNVSRSVTNYRANILQLAGIQWKIKNNFFHIANPETNVLSYGPRENQQGDVEVEGNQVFDETGNANSFVLVAYFHPGLTPSQFVEPLTYTANSIVKNNHVLGFIGNGAFDPTGLVGGFSGLATPADLAQQAEQGIPQAVNFVQTFAKKYGPNWQAVLVAKQKDAVGFPIGVLKTEGNTFYSIPRKQRFLAGFYGATKKCVSDSKKFDSLPGFKNNTLLESIPDDWKTGEFCRPELHINYRMLFEPEGKKAVASVEGWPEAKCD